VCLSRSIFDDAFLHVFDFDEVTEEP
jgi:hypothetical protein